MVKTLCFQVYLIMMSSLYHQDQSIIVFVVVSYHCSGNDDREGPVLTDSKFYIDAKDVILYTCEGKSIN